MDDKEQRDDDTDCHSDFNTPTDRQDESQEHKSEVDPSSHPMNGHTVRRAHHRHRR